jgi:hypothetical protein
MFLVRIGIYIKYLQEMVTKSNGDIRILSNIIINNYWMRLSMISRIIQTEVNVICRSEAEADNIDPTSFPGSFFGEGKTLVGAGHVAHRKLIA